MSDRNYRSYSQEFKLEALELLQRGDKRAGQIERELGITPGLLGKWKARYQIVTTEGQTAEIAPSDMEAAKAEIRRMQRELANMEEERDIQKKSSEYLLTEKRMKYRYIAEHERVYAVQRMCWVLGVQRSGYYAWKQRPVSP